MVHSGVLYILERRRGAPQTLWGPGKTFLSFLPLSTGLVICGV